MILITHEVTCENGLHARPVAVLCKLAKEFASTIIAVNGGRTANVKSTMKLMLLGAKQGDHIDIRIDGDDEVQAREALDYFFENDLKNI